MTRPWWTEEEHDPNWEPTLRRKILKVPELPLNASGIQKAPGSERLLPLSPPTLSFLLLTAFL